MAKDINIRNIICIKIKCVSNKELKTLSQIYDMDLGILKEFRDVNKLNRIWVDVVTHDLIALTCHNGYDCITINSEYLPITAKLKKALFNIDIINKKLVSNSSNIKSKIDLDSILDKISVKGLDSLTENEYKTLESFKDVNTIDTHKKTVNVNKTTKFERSNSISLTLDDVLDKINKSGLNSLTDYELDILKNA